MFCITPAISATTFRSSPGPCWLSSPFSAWPNPAGLGTGFVGSLGYWLSQQNVARGSQPWYYYMIMLTIFRRNWVKFIAAIFQKGKSTSLPAKVAG